MEPQQQAAAACAGAQALANDDRGNILQALNLAFPYGFSSNTQMAQEEPNFGYILYYRDPVGTMLSGVDPQFQAAAQRLSLGRRVPQVQWPGPYLGRAGWEAIWTHPYYQLPQPTLGEGTFAPDPPGGGGPLPPIGEDDPVEPEPDGGEDDINQNPPPAGYNPPLRDWAVVEIIPNAPAGMPRRPAAQAAPGSLELRRGGSDRYTAVWVRVVDISRCVDAPGPAPRNLPGAMAELRRRGLRQTRPPGLGGGWDPRRGPPAGNTMDVSAINTYFNVPLQFIRGFWRTGAEAIAARDAEFNRQYLAARAAAGVGGGGGGGGGGRPPAGTGPRVGTDDEDATTTTTNAQLIQNWMTQAGISDQQDQQPTFQCPLITNPDYNMCDFYSDPTKSQTIETIIGQACPEMTFHDDGSVTGTCSEVCREAMIRWWDGGSGRIQ